MADTTYRIGVDTGGAIRAIDGLKTALGGLALAFAAREFTQVASIFESLRVTLQILYKDIQRGNAVFADIKKFAQSSSFSVDDLTETVIKLKSAGLDPTINQLRFFAEVSAVAADKVGALRAITDLYARTTAGGLGLEDLNRLADRGIPVFTILKDVLGINRLEITKLGQSAQGAQIILRALEQGLTKAFGGGSDLRANTLSQALSNLRDAFNNAIDSMGQEGGLNDALAKLANSFADIIKQAQPLLIILAQGLVSAINFVKENATTFAKIFTVLLGFAISRIIIFVGTLIASLLKLGVVFSVLARHPLVAALILLGSALAYVAGKMGLLKDILPSIQPEIDATNKEIKDMEDSLKGLGLSQGDAIGTTDELKGKIGGLNQEINKLNASYNIYTDQVRRNTSAIFDRLGFQARIIGKTDEEVELQTELNSEYQRFSQRIQELRDRQTELRANLINENDTMKVAAYAHEIDLINKLINTETEGHKENNHQINYGINLIQSQRLAEEDRKRVLEQISAEIERQADLQGKLRDAILEARGRLEEEQYKRSRLPGLAGQITDIQRANRLAAEEAARGFAAGFNIEDMTAADAERLRAGLNRIAEAYGEITTIQIEQLEYSRTWADGWDQAFERYRESAYNAAEQAKTYFETFTRGFENAIVRFVQTGKLSFKDLFSSLLAEFARIQASKMLMNFLGASGTGGFFRNLFGGGGYAESPMGFSIPAFAKGGVVNRPTFGLIGEAGPEAVIPLDQMNRQRPQSQPTQITYNIQAVDAPSFRALVARDPQFIYSVSEAGRRSQPSRRLA